MDSQRRSSKYMQFRAYGWVTVGNGEADAFRRTLDRNLQEYAVREVGGVTLFERVKVK